MKTCYLSALMLCFFVGHPEPVRAADTLPLGDATGPWLGLLRSDNPTLRTTAVTALADLVRKHPAVANDFVRGLAEEQRPDVAADYAQRLVPLANGSPATVSALIQVIRDRKTNYKARNFGVKVMSQVGAAAATPEFVEALAESYCPVPGALLRIMRALGKDAIPILVAGNRHPNGDIRERAARAIRYLGRTDPAILNLLQ